MASALALVALPAQAAPGGPIPQADSAAAAHETTPDDDTPEEAAAEVSREPTLTLKLTPSFLIGADAVRATVRFSRDELNRVLRVAIDNQADYASSHVQVRGADGPTIHEFVWDRLSTGVYRVSASLLRADGTEQSVARCLVVLTHAGQASASSGASLRHSPGSSGYTAADGGALPTCH